MIYKNGYRIPYLNGTAVIDACPFESNQLMENELDGLKNCRPTLSYTCLKSEPVPKFIPSYVECDKKVLRFYGYFKETVTESPQECYRVRVVTICYYIEDDSMDIYEPMQPNSGLSQGTLTYFILKSLCQRFVHYYYTLHITSFSSLMRIITCTGWVLKRRKIPKNDRGDHYIWKDLNIGINIAIYGRVYRIANCDEFTRVIL